MKGVLLGTYRFYPMGDGVVDLNDLLCTLDAFGNPTSCVSADQKPCGLIDGTANLDDLLVYVAAFAGETYPVTCAAAYPPACPPSTPAPPKKQPYYFTGQRLDFDLRNTTTNEPYLALYHYRARAYDPLHGRFLQRDPAEYVDGMHLYAFAKNNPLLFLDPSGTKSFEVSEKYCTITLNYWVQFDWQGTWTQARKEAFMYHAELEIEKAWNRQVFRIYPTSLGTSGKCKCKCDERGFRPKVDFHGGDTWWDDATFHVTAGATPPLGRASAVLGGSDAWLFEDSVTDRTKRPGLTQVDVVHEFGHLLGINHPGQYMTPPITPPNSPADYDADMPSLMGAGMELRISYFDQWRKHLDSKYKTCRPFTTR